MFSIVFSALLMVSAVSCQGVRSTVIQNSRADAAAPAAAAAAPAPAPAAAAAPAVAPSPFARCPQCFGPGVNNPLALPPNQLILNKAVEVASSLPNVRLFFDVDGSLTPTDQFGREVEVQDAFGRDAFDFEDQLELQQQTFRQGQQLQQERIRLEQQLSNIMRLLGGTAGAGAAAPAGAAPAAAPVAPRFTISV